MVKCRKRRETGYAVAKLRLLDDGRLLQIFDLSEGGVFGRDPDADFVVNHLTVSRRHVGFTVRGAEIEMQDLGSANGTSVNGRQLDRRPLLLEHGDQLQFGALTASFHSAEGDSDDTLKRGPTAKGSRSTTVGSAGLLEHQMRLGRLAQRRLLVDRPPTIDGYELAHILLPAMGVGGDFIHWSETIDGRFGLVIGDVCGKGVPAAIYMAYVSGLLMEIVPNAISARSILERTNRTLQPLLEPGMFVSAVALLIDPADHRIEQASAGHGALLIKRADGRIEETRGPPGLALGLDANPDISAATIELEPGDLLMVFTDGVNEARNKAGEDFERWRVLDVLARSAGAVDVTRRLQSAIARHSDGAQQHDDITVVTLERL